MTREEIIELMAEKWKLVRVEADYTQDKMADIIGISKKTLVQIEKGRILPSWTAIIAVCALFSTSATLQNAFGGEPMEVIETVARESIDYRKEKTMGGKIWWKTLGNERDIILQQNIISKHFRIIDADHFRLYSSFDEENATRTISRVID